MASLIFIGHEASLSGAPYTQLYLIQWLRANTSHTVELVLLRGGPLVKEFEKVANVHIVHKYAPYPPFHQRILRKTEALTRIGLRSMFNRLAKSKPSLIFANAVPALEFAVEVKKQLHIPLLVNVHELQSTFFYCDAELFAENAKEIDVLIPGSQAVKKYFQTFCSVPEAKIKVVYDFIGDATGGNTTAAEVRQELSIPADAKIVGGIGAFNWRKAPDLFLQAARYCLENSQEDIRFIWIGGDLTSMAHQEMQYDIRALGLEGKMLLVGTKVDLRGYYEAFDVFLLTSREDPFPLVCLESALQGSPTICFERAGGMPEFVREDAGFVVPYGDAQAMGEKTALLINQDGLRQQMGQVAKERAKAHHTISVIGPQMYEAMQPFLSK
ncbi:MAG: glycosyltransferase family 1 protein [Hymenobacter sp.]|nr:MAG: glycosyltransferase family 1 protein [Hymenobacter sp.]